MNSRQISGILQVAVSLPLFIVFLLVLLEFIPMPRWGMWAILAIGVFNLMSFAKGLYDRRDLDRNGTRNG